jgi:hypothetical protein
MASQTVRQQLTTDYSEALRDSPMWIRMAFKAFLLMPDRYVTRKPFLYWVLNMGTPNFKMSKRMSLYGNPKVHGQSCGNCMFAYQKVVSKYYICSQIRDRIEPHLWCKLWDTEKNYPQLQ